ncbi:MAG: flagellar biosynthetic protein FliO [Ruminococcus sp.]|nr:flagellar biosynthetic protein FliO [Ruminococcus sp.]
MAEIVSVIFALILVIAVMIGVIFLMKWLLGRISGSTGTSAGLKMISCISVGQDRSVAVVKAGEQYLLLGITPGGISMLCRLEDEDIVLIESGSPETQAKRMQGKSFAECLKYNIRKMGGEFITPSSGSDENKKDL